MIGEEIIFLESESKTHLSCNNWVAGSIVQRPQWIVEHVALADSGLQSYHLQCVYSCGRFDRGCAAPCHVLSWRCEKQSHLDCYGLLGGIQPCSHMDGLV